MCYHKIQQNPFWTAESPSQNSYKWMNTVNLVSSTVTSLWWTVMLPTVNLPVPPLTYEHCTKLYHSKKVTLSDSNSIGLISISSKLWNLCIWCSPVREVWTMEPTWRSLKNVRLWKAELLFLSALLLEVTSSEHWGSVMPVPTSQA